MEISGWIEGWARLAPKRTALRFEGRELSYAAFAGDIARTAAALESAGVGRGDCVGFLGLNSPRLLEILFACARRGAMFMPLNWRLAAPEHRQMLEDCPPRLLFVESGFVAQTEAIRDGLDGTRFVSLGGVPEGWMTWEQFAAGAAAQPGESAGTLSGPLLLCYTSGSTGKPKGVVLTQEALFYNAINSAHLHGLTAADRVLTTLPMFHVGGLNNQTLPALHAGATVTLHAKFDPESTFETIAAERITLTCLVPAQIDMMMASPRWGSDALASLRMISTGSCIIPERISRAVHAKGIPLPQIYGSTETCPIATYLLPEDALKKPGSAGKAGVHCRVKVVDELGAELPVEMSGEVWVKGPNVMLGYWKAPEATAQVLREGWFATGDIGYFDPEGYLWINGRKKEMIISGGENVYPAEIENALSECPGVEEVSVVGEPDGRWGEIVVAVVVRRAGAELDEAGVLGALDGRIARYKHPRKVVFVDRLPRTALGKIRKEDVRGMLRGA